MTDLNGLTALDIAALRAADRLTLHHHMGEGYIRAIREIAEDVTRPRHRELFPILKSHQERHRHVPVFSMVGGYSDEDGGRSRWTATAEDKVAACYHMVWAAQSDEEWCTIAGLLRREDRLTLLWRAGNNNGYLDDAGLFRDELRLRVTGRGGRQRTFLVNVNVSPNNSARPIKRRGYRA